MQRADKRKYHYIYKITRDDGRYYIGMHSSDNLDDGYFGSGKKITRSIKKHGKEKHAKEILEFLPSRKELKAREEEMITEEIRSDPFCMNLAPGGGGGFINEDHLKKATLAGLKSPKRDHKSACKKAYQTKLLRGSSLGGSDGFRGKIHTAETREHLSAVMKEKQTGEKNSQFGTCWVTNGKPVKIKKEQLDEYLANGYSRGRKMPL